MKIKGIIFEDFINYKKPSMVIEFPYCNFKCDKECGQQVCQNSKLAKAPNKDVSITNLVKTYMNNNITEAIVFQGLEPFDSKDDLYQLIKVFREYTNNDIVIYTGYTETELDYEIETLKRLFKNIIVKFGRFIPDQQSRFDEILGVTLASSNQYAKKIC
jgi:hypothetical protein